MIKTLCTVVISYNFCFYQKLLALQRSCEGELFTFFILGHKITEQKDHCITFIADCFLTDIL